MLQDAFKLEKREGIYQAWLCFNQKKVESFPKAPPSQNLSYLLCAKAG